MKQRFKHISLNWLILGPMSVVFLTGIMGSWWYEGWWQDVFLNAAFMGLGVLVTVFYVEKILDRRDERKWSEPKSTIDIRLRRTAAKFLRATEFACGTDPTHARFFVPAWHDRVDPLDSLRELYRNEAWITYLKEEVLPAARSLEAIQDLGKIDVLIDGLNQYRERLLEVTLLSQGRLSPSQAANVAHIFDDIPVQLHYLTVRRSGNTAYLGPLLENIVERSIELVEESNRNPDAYLLTVEERAALAEVR